MENNLADSPILLKVLAHLTSVTLPKIAITSVNVNVLHLVDIDSDRMSKTFAKPSRAVSPFQRLGHPQPSTNARNLAW